MRSNFYKLSKLTHAKMFNVATKQVSRRSNACRKCLPWITLKQIRLNRIESFDHLPLTHNANPKVLTFKNQPPTIQPQNTTNKSSPQLILPSKFKFETWLVHKIWKFIFQTHAIAWFCSCPPVFSYQIFFFVWILHEATSTIINSSYCKY